MNTYLTDQKNTYFVNSLKDGLLIIIGIFSASFGFKGFLLTNDFIDGGATGISLLISAVSGIPLYVLIIVVNLPFIFMGYKIMGKQFAIKTALAIARLALCVAFVLLLFLFLMSPMMIY
ncbi:YitT family protein [Wenyingzhuangia sp. chi5]|uniref:YitT family protein n=1 Tax=Wenyingzhuangia gilva TaxID=3057677 RepID=A0ABT8VS94_9FLAO|nr:YitT family protein [Wenyingzhuangia sp. chi5]MDO3694827.1 YitT family protein [Wenyingzhuangia sp. chi5]